MDNNPVRPSYDYTSGSGIDGFMSRSLDEVNWQNNLEASYNTLGNLPIGLSPTTSTPTNYDLTQISGSQSGTSSIGGSSGSGTGTGLSINAGQQNITLNDGTNDRLLLGRDVGGF